MFDLSNKLIVITGRSRGNGKGIADGLLEFGAEIIVVDIKFDSELNKNFIKIKGDITNSLTIDRVLKKINNSKKELVLINNAGISAPSNKRPYPLENWNKTILINLTTPFLWIESFIGPMTNKMGGSIINITSLAAEKGFPNNPAYVASKGGLKMLTKAFSKDLGKFNIRLNNVGPGYFKTHMTLKSYENPELREKRQNHMLLNRWGEPKDLIGICAYLSSSLSSYVTGQDFYVDGGWLANGLND